MEAPNNKPTDKTERRLAKERQRRLYAKITQSQPPPQSPSAKYMQMDLKSLLESVMNSEDMQEEILKEATKRIDTEDAVKTVKLILSEYFDSFILLGYDVNGNRSIIRYANSDRDDDSIIEMMRYVLMRMLNGE